MVDVSEVRNFLSPDDVADGAVFTVDVETTHRVAEFTDRSTGEKRKRVVLGLIGANKPVTLNGTSVKALTKAYGANTSKWVGQRIKAIKTKANIRGELVNVLYFEPATEKAKAR